jgi:hypothetical protein
MNAFAVALKKEGQMVEARPTMERALDAGTKIMEGSSMAAAFGQQGNGKWRFNSADHYVGHARRMGGRNVGGTPDAATDAIVKGLGFRGLQYGNSVTDDERKHHVQKAAEALVDLADATGLPDSAIGLNGTLGLAIGARGRGGAVAHYEPTMKVINLTRKKGVGSLSHEWGHALDNYAAGGGSFLSQNSGAPEKRAAMNEVKSAWTTSGFTRQVYDSIREVKKAGGQLSEEYWLSDVEMFARSFEAHVSLKLEKAGRSNTYLTREFDDSGMKKGNAAERRLGDGLWPTRKQAEAMEPMFDALLAQIKKDDFPGASNRRDSREDRIQRLIQEAYQAAATEHQAHATKLQQRSDAVKRKCATGYSCGASCISMSKQCRKSPGAGPGQQKMKRILALAAGKEGGLAVRGGANANVPQRLAFKLAYHGTSQEAAQAIRESGYKETKYGTYGAGVYTTTNRKAAKEYAQWRSAGGKDRYGEQFPASNKGPAVLVHRLPKQKVSVGDPYTYENRQIVESGGARRLGKDVTKHQPYVVMGKGLADRSLVKQASTIRKRLRRNADSIQARLDALRASCTPLNG